LKGIGNLWLKRVDNIPLGQDAHETPVRVEHDYGANVLAFHQGDRATDSRSGSDADDIPALARKNFADTHRILLPKTIRARSGKQDIARMAKNVGVGA
jgi:hypothetical protein